MSEPIRLWEQDGIGQYHNVAASRGIGINLESIKKNALMEMKSITYTRFANRVNSHQIS